MVNGMQKTFIQYCRVQTDRGAGSRRQQLQRRIRQQSFRVPGLPPSAILLIRKCGLALNRQGGTASNAAFLRQAAAKAVRPENGHIPGNAPAILFWNRAEALAFLSNDFLKPDHRKRWWWQALLGSKTLPGIGDIAGLYLQHAESAPAALRYLLAWKSLAPFAASLDKSSAQKLLHGMLQKYHAVGFLQRMNWDMDPSRSTAPRHATAQTILHQFWRRQLADANLPETGGYYQTLFAGVGLLLAREPGLLHHPEFCRTFERLQTVLKAMLEEDREQSLPLRDKSRNPNGSIQMPPYLASGEWVRAAVVNQELQPRHSDGDKSIKTTMDNPPDGSRLLLQKDRSSHDNDAPDIPPDRNVETDDTLMQVEPNAVILPGRQDISTGIAQSTPDAALDFSDSGMCTLLGGLFFLLPLLRRLELLQWRGGPFSCLSELRPWERLELLGESLLQEESSTFQGDPVWRLLALLDGREAGEAAGGRLQRAHEYLLPPDWLGHLPADANAWTAQFDGRYLKVLHPAGVTAADIPCSPETLPEKCRRVNAAFDLALDWRRVENTTVPLSSAEPPASESQRWAAVMRPFLRHLIAAIFPDAPVPERDVVKRLLYRTADIYYGAPHLDILFPLESSDIAIRKAGLDANPGWLPELGLVVTFYFR